MMTTLVDVTLLNSLIPLPTFSPPPVVEQAPDLPGARSAAAAEDDSANAAEVSTRAWTTPGSSSARYPDLTMPLSLLALIGGSGALAAESKRRKQHKKEKSGLTEVQRRHQAKVEKRWKEEAEKEAVRKRLDSHRGADSKIERLEAEMENQMQSLKFLLLFSQRPKMRVEGSSVYP